MRFIREYKNLKEKGGFMKPRRLDEKQLEELYLKCKECDCKIGSCTYSGCPWKLFYARYK